MKKTNINLFPFLIGKVLTLFTGLPYLAVRLFPFLIGKVLTGGTTELTNDPKFEEA